MKYGVRFERGVLAPLRSRRTVCSAVKRNKWLFAAVRCMFHDVQTPEKMRGSKHHFFHPPYGRL